MDRVAIFALPATAVALTAVLALLALTEQPAEAERAGKVGEIAVKHPVSARESARPLGRPLYRGTASLASDSLPEEALDAGQGPERRILEPGRVLFPGEADSALESWDAQDRTDEAPRRERAVRDLFERGDVSHLLWDAECRESLCKLTLDGAVLGNRDNGAKRLAGKLGRAVAVLEASANRIVVLIPGGDLPKQQ